MAAVSEFRAEGRLIVTVAIRSATSISK